MHSLRSQFKQGKVRRDKEPQHSCGGAMAGGSEFAEGTFLSQLIGRRAGVPTLPNSGLTLATL